MTRGMTKQVYSKKVPIPQPDQNFHNSAPQHNVQAKLRLFLILSLPIRAIRSCRTEALSNLARHLN